MNVAGVLLVATSMFCAGRLSHYRTILGQQDDIEYLRQHVDAADSAIDVRTRGWRSALHRARRLRSQQWSTGSGIVLLSDVGDDSVDLPPSAAIRGEVS